MSDFAAQIKAFRDKTLRTVDTVVQEATVNIATALVERTPVDKTALRANWQFTADTPGAEVDYSLRDLSMNGESTAGALAAQIRAVSAGHVTYVVNNLPYVLNVEYGLYPSPSRSGKTINGFSTQAPAGVRSVTAIEWPTFVKTAIAKALI